MSVQLESRYYKFCFVKWINLSVQSFISVFILMPMRQKAEAPTLIALLGSGFEIRQSELKKS